MGHPGSAIHGEVRHEGRSLHADHERRAWTRCTSPRSPGRTTIVSGTAVSVAQSAAEPGAVLAELRAALEPSQLVTDLDVVERYRRDEADWAEFGVPLAWRGRAAPPRSRTSCACVLGMASRSSPVAPAPALSGGANAVDGCVVLCTERMRAIVEINPGERLAVVQPGVVNDDLRAAAAEHGLWYPPDPSSAALSTIGGNVATNAGGLCCVKYGVTRDYVLALEVVTAAGEVVRLGRRTAKGVAGYDLVGLMVGSEGTLGVITEVTVRLRPARAAPPVPSSGFFDTLPAAARPSPG